MSVKKGTKMAKKKRKKFESLNNGNNFFLLWIISLELKERLLENSFSL
jgi:hypothetical protein